MRKLVATFFALALMAVAPMVVAQTQNSSGLAGKWHFMIETGDGGREYDAEFKVADGKVTGTFGKFEAKGTVDSEKFALEFPVETDEAGKGVLKLTGTVAQDQLSGAWSFQTYDGMFKATRPKPAL